MDVNFKIKDLIYIIYEGYEVDLHNAYNFNSRQVEINETEISIPFSRLKNNDTVNASPFEELRFTAYNYTYYQEYEPDLSFIAEDHTLDGITFFPSSDRETNNALINQAEPNNSDDLIFIFLSDRIIRIKAQKIIITHQ